MRRAVVICTTALTLAGCANVIDAQPSYLGMTGVMELQDADKTGPMPPAVKHMTSNRVLGAMAFKKVTGADVDPSRLSGLGN